MNYLDLRPSYLKKLDNINPYNAMWNYYTTKSYGETPKELKDPIPATVVESNHYLLTFGLLGGLILLIYLEKK